MACSNCVTEARKQVIREIQAFAGDYSHEVTKDGATRQVVIVEQLIDFLREPSSEEFVRE